jgi:hypothetical protein
MTNQHNVSPTKKTLAYKVFKNRACIPHMANGVSTTKYYQTPTVLNKTAVRPCRRLIYTFHLALPWKEA